MEASWSPLTPAGAIRPEILRPIDVLRREQLIVNDPGPHMTLGQLEELGQHEWATGKRRERRDLPPLGQHLESEVWPDFTEAGFTSGHWPVLDRYNGLFATFGGAPAAADKLGFAAEAATTVDFGEFISLAGDRELRRGQGEIDDDAVLFAPEGRYGGLRLISTEGAEALTTEAGLIAWYWRRLELPRALWQLPFWQAQPEDLRQPGIMRAQAPKALGYWPGLKRAFGPYAVLGKAPHRPFQELTFEDAVRNGTVEWIGPGIEPGFAPNSVAQLFDGLARGVHCYIKFEQRQVRDPLA